MVLRARPNFGPQALAGLGVNKTWSVSNNMNIFSAASAFGQGRKLLRRSSIHVGHIEAEDRETRQAEASDNSEIIEVKLYAYDRHFVPGATSLEPSLVSLIQVSSCVLKMIPFFFKASI